jgi:hypothetical protein
MAPYSLRSPDTIFLVFICRSSRYEYLPGAQTAPQVAHQAPGVDERRPFLHVRSRYVGGRISLAREWEPGGIDEQKILSKPLDASSLSI